MLKDAERGAFAYVMVYDTSRFTRGGNTDFWWLVCEMKKRRVKIFCCKRRQVVTEKDAVLFAAEASQAHDHNVNLARDVTRTVLLNVTKRNCDPGRRAPYGFDRLYITATGEPYQKVRQVPDGTKQVLNPADDRLIMTIPKGEKYGKIRSNRVLLTPSEPTRVALAHEFFVRALSLSPTDIADGANRRGLVGPCGGRWNASSIRAILRNLAYVGTIIFNKRQESRYYCIRGGNPVALDYLDEGKVNVRLNPQNEWIILENAHQAIIEPELFWKVQAVLDARSHGKIRSPRSKRRIYLLSGMAACARCKQPLQGQTTTASKAKGGKQYPKYTCSSARKFGKSVCPHYGVPAETLEAWAMAKVRELLSSPPALAALRQGLERLVASPQDSAASVRELHSRLAAIERRKVEVFQALDAKHMEFFKAQIDELIAEEALIRNQLAKPAHKPAMNNSAAFVERALRFYQEKVLFLQGKCRKSIREVFRALGLRLEYNPDGKEGRLHLFPFGQPASR